MTESTVTRRGVDNMDSIVKHGLKIDLHVHSCASASKDGSKVKDNTIENVPLLIRKLDENNVNICAITDHDMMLSLQRCQSQ